MRQVTASEFARKFAEYQQSIHKGAIQVCSHSRVTGYFLSPEEFSEYEALKSKARKVLYTGNLPDDLMRDLRNTSMDSRHAHLDALMDS